MTNKCSFTTIVGTCGVGLEFDFTSNPASWYQPTATRFGGIDYNIAGFINNDPCKQAYETIKRKTDIVFQSPVKRNRNSGHQFFFIVYKRKGT